MRVLIFTEGGENIGLGHITRCSALYEEIESRRVDVKFIINSNELDKTLLQSKNVEYTDWLSINYLENTVKEEDYCIIDSYLADINAYEIITKKSKRSLYIDDIGRLKYPIEGMVVNPSLNPYKLYENIDKGYLLGNNYIILRQPFIKAIRKNVSERVSDVLVIMGGVDIRNVTPLIINALCSKYIHAKFHIVSNTVNNSNMKNVMFYQNLDASEMKNLMIKCDIAITAAGQTIYELIATRTPFIPIQVIENQDSNIEGLLMYNLHESCLHADNNNLKMEIECAFHKLQQVEKRIRLSQLYSNIIDGLGTKRIVNNFLNSEDTY